MGKIKDITGQMFGRATALHPCGIKGHRLLWNCKCSCGQTFVASGVDLRSGNTKSCGCYAKDRTSQASTTHGVSRSGALTGAYRSWRSMRQRCDDPGATSYGRYGARGISYCESWRIFENFLADMGDRPNGHSLERIDPNGNYEPSNCKWVPHEKQAENTRHTVRVRLDGEVLHQAEAARRLGVHPARLIYWRRKPSSMPTEFASRLEWQP